jgi:probable rRNA maturation factor
MIQLFNTTTAVLPVNQQDVDELLKLVADTTGVGFETVELVYVDTDTIVDINRRYLERDYITDVISFRLDDDDDQAIEGTIYCCIPRLQEQALEYHVSERHEFARIAIHGLLHLTGYDDTSSDEKKAMTHMEDQLLTKWLQ